MRVETWECDRCGGALPGKLDGVRLAFVSGAYGGTTSVAVDLCQSCLDAAIAFVVPPGKKVRVAWEASGIDDPSTWRVCVTPGPNLRTEPR